MDGVSVKLDVASALLYLEEKGKSLFGKDLASQEISNWLTGLQTTAITQTRFVQCLGMHKPVDFHEIYQPTALTIKAAPSKQQYNYAYQDKVGRSIVEGQRASHREVNTEDFFKSSDDAIIFAGPGWGKTTFLHYIYRRHVHSSDVFPLLVTLRRPTAIEDLRRFVEIAAQTAKKQKAKSILLLVDAYDEISPLQRRLVSEALLTFQSLGVGKFYLTCREYYDVYDLAAAEVHIRGFATKDKYRFVSAFLKAFESPLDAKTIVDELDQRGFTKFLSHPLLLALACIVKTSPSDNQPRSALRLLERAIEVLKDRWDESKGITRERYTPLDGRDRIQLLKRIAFIATSGYLSRDRAEGVARAQIDLLNLDKIDPRKALLETAQFYGILVPTDEGWEFVHRTVHDFLAASYWVETGEFASVDTYDWTSRTAYAACLTRDATAVFEAALSAVGGLPVVVEMLTNAAPMKNKTVAQAVKTYFSQEGRFEIFSDAGSSILTAKLSSDFVQRAHNVLLDHLVDQYASARSKSTDVIVAYCLLELRERGHKLDFVTYKSLVDAYGEDFSMQVPGLGLVQVAEMNPERSKPSRRLIASERN